MSAPRIYLDHAATTPMLPAAREAMADALGRWANPSSPHREGRAARAALEEARARIKAALGWQHELIFTSGATESAAIALTRHAIPRPVFVSAVEHSAVLRSGADATLLPIGADGIVQLAGLPDGAIVAVQHANNETGILQPIERIASDVAEAGGILFVDCAQTAGKLPLPDADLIAVSAHKLSGPPGIGALLVRDIGLLAPLGQGQEKGYRAGTENLPAILGFAAALEGASDGTAPWVGAQAEWRGHLDDMVVRLGGEVIGADSSRIPTIAAYRLPGLSTEAQLIRLDMAGFAVSAGSACSSGSLHASHVLAAMALSEQAAREVIRVSFGRTTTEPEVRAFAKAWAEMARGVSAQAA
ncbi:aminotransferase class V-fold PLP-dependent enzyme [Sphingomonas sp. BIUV-7]|uniref:Cysteine desulfurase n=1 Tax=Sphingomonas natans TaxID=3063330 RepID=A0ABT8YBQ8_9SPHN|nr:aminotransferase class V-fold PLP-dependent enzyme [Sphingomonas sp. BIUV-7]MDO6415760.1 aminotransferase class V-fold PLP-dependent enzyme [Sphingomonas sp. BIUV-7]